MFIEGAQLFPILLAASLNLLLSFKIFKRPNLHNIFNISLACLLGFNGVVGPFLVYLYATVLKNYNSNNDEEPGLFDRRFVCARFQELRILVLVAQQVVANNIMFRFFVIVHADKGFVSKSLFNTKFLKFCFVGYTLFFSIYSFVPYLTSTMISDEYPQNTVKGRICLGQRLDWDKDNSKETSDIYIKPRLIILALVLCSLFLTFYLFIYKARKFIKGFCVAQKSFASIGGRRRRNLLTFQELSVLHFMILSFILLESLLVFFFYKEQDNLGTKTVFFLHLLSTGLADLVMIILLPAVIVFNTRHSYPEIWTSYTPQPYKYYATAFQLVPRRKQTDFDNVGGHTDKEENNFEEAFEDSKQESYVDEGTWKQGTVLEQNQPINNLPPVDI